VDSSLAVALHICALKMDSVITERIQLVLLDITSLVARMPRTRTLHVHSNVVSATSLFQEHSPTNRGTNPSPCLFLVNFATSNVVYNTQSSVWACCNVWEFTVEPPGCSVPSNTTFQGPSPQELLSVESASASLSSTSSSYLSITGSTTVISQTNSTTTLSAPTSSSSALTSSNPKPLSLRQTIPALVL
jgi:hypothetical protein